MAVLIWREEREQVYNSIRTGRRVFLSAEEFRPEAEALDERLDELLDDALALMAENAGEGKPSPLVKAWSLGRAVARSQALRHKAMHGEVRAMLWQALAHKCWYGVRADATRESRWRELRSTGKRAERRVNPEKSQTNKFKYEDFDIGLWLSDQDLDEAGLVFGNSMANALELYRRPTLKSHELRQAILPWYREQSELVRKEFSRATPGAKGFKLVAKALAARFPSSGPGSARLPQHYEPAELQRIVNQALDAARDAHFPPEPKQEQRNLV